MIQCIRVRAAVNGCPYFAIMLRMVYWDLATGI
jgi:hypothetical protein